MSLVLLAAATVTLVSVTEIDLASPTIYVSKDARTAIASGSRATLSCVDLPKRSRIFRSACLTGSEWQRAVELAEQNAQGRRLNRSENLAQNFASERFNDDTFSLMPR